MSQSRTTTHPDIEGSIAVVAGHLNVFHAQLVSLVAAALETDDWRGDRIHTPAQWLAWRAGVSPERAQQIVSVAERRRDFPHVVASFERGELTLDQVAVVVTRAPSWADQQVLDFARSATVGQLRRYMRSEHFEAGPASRSRLPSLAIGSRLAIGTTAAGASPGSSTPLPATPSPSPSQSARHQRKREPAERPRVHEGGRSRRSERFTRRRQ